MHPENQDRIKRLADEHGTDSLVVVLGAADLEAIEVAAETVTAGDPAYVGPLAGVQLGLPVVHILDDCGHCPQIESTRRFVELLLEFPRRLARAA